VREGNSTHREAYEPERTVPALDPGGGSRWRPDVRPLHTHTVDAR
jgi:hypothetical protein